jgi:nucleotide-binding universal stress UspA family protein
MFSKILLAYNGTQEGRTGLLECAEVMALAKAETHLLAVANPPPLMLVEGFEGIAPGDRSEVEEERMKKVLAEGIDAMKQQGYHVTGHFAVGEPVQEICRMAGELGCDLIVVGHQQKHSFLERWWRGSISAALIDYAPCSVLIVMTRASDRATG